MVSTLPSVYVSANFDDFQGVCYDHVELKFQVNGEWAEPSITGIKGPVMILQI